MRNHFKDEIISGKTLFIILVCCHGMLVRGERCDGKSCYFYSYMAGQIIPLFQSAGIQYFGECDCARYGLTLPSVTTTASPSKPRSCGVSTLTGSAIEYLISRVEPKIVGGVSAEECEYPWTAHVKAGGFNCGGTLIDNKHVITASHCLQTGNYLIPAGDIEVGVGSSSKQRMVYYKVSTVTRHPNFYPATFGFDIAVLTLEINLPDNNACMQPACLPSLTLNISVGTQCIIAGWGALKESGTSPDQLQKAVVRILDPGVCVSAYGGTMMDDRKLCAGYTAGEIDACQGDSGGPLLCADGYNWALAGIVSFGLGCARAGYPGVYTHVSNLQPWIEMVIR